MENQMNIDEKRDQDRIPYERPEFVSVEFRTGKGAEKDKVYDLNVIDCSGTGLGMLITQRDFDLLKILKEGDTLEDMTFFATWTMITVDGTVRHKTRIEEGKHKGCYIMGIKSKDIIESCRPEEH